QHFHRDEYLRLPTTGVAYFNENASHSLPDAFPNSKERLSLCPNNIFPYNQFIPYLSQHRSIHNRLPSSPENTSLFSASAFPAKLWPLAISINSSLARMKLISFFFQGLTQVS